MTTATDRWAGPRSAAVRSARAVVIALLAALAVLVHHDTTCAAIPARAMSAMADMDHSSTAMTAGASVRQGAALQAADTAMDDDGGACSGHASQHCSSADVGTAKITPPPAAVHVGRSDASYRVLAGHGSLGTSHRAPPDLSVLSRLLI